uniref:Conserved conjugative plasmid protein n=1 Tax=Saccharolobus solfataricus (strain ATCC 35092 / DSM 1617 / JCM 11322 / P2) TaxID=273057 RepID=S6DM09_SACS2|nr:cell division protein ZapB [Saccharolobus solfataricus]CDF66447.1 conserved conjugative plasmid protein [Saccharolobus solfataricus P2]
MTINEIIQQNEELQRQYAKAIDTITRLQNEIAKLKRENVTLKNENMRLRRQNNILERAMEIAIGIKDYNAQTRFLKKVLEKLRETGEFTR